MSKISLDAMTDAFSIVMKRHKENKGWSVARLAKVTQISRPTLHKYINALQSPNLINAFAISEALGFSLNEVANELGYNTITILKDNTLPGVRTNNGIC